MLSDYSDLHHSTFLEQWVSLLPDFQKGIGYNIIQNKVKLLAKSFIY